MSLNRKFFFDYARLSLFDGRLNASQVSGISSILDEWERSYSNLDDRFLAYMFATIHLETGRTMQPIAEWERGRNHPYGKRIKMSRKPYTDTNQIFYGRGFVQLTWYENYDRAGKKLSKNFLKNADDVMKLDNATKILFYGMLEGWFTGKKLSDFFSKTKEDWPGARKIINGSNKAELIASYAKKYYSCISYTV